MKSKSKPAAAGESQESNKLTDKLETVRDILFGAQGR
jgi:hypothetical protein